MPSKQKLGVKLDGDDYIERRIGTIQELVMVRYGVMSFF